ncbi:hypothetical protein J5N97_025929 [Dioscorea zingiberensis]|uniref:TF-B3 domain-containing protein n=1 Tax=Dioscorea zingiberensis TaxID=325984 RepID=A0A9D5C159_9LILI|nr:hypothetical protein J5N97_025929 [Dioscorea zingiberensis]
MVFTLKVFDLSGCRKYHTPKKRKATSTADEDTENIALNDDSGRPKRRSSNAEESMELKKKMATSSFAEKQSQLINMKKGIQFSKTIRKSNVVHSYLGVPVSFCASNGFSTTQEVILRDSKGKSFPVNLSSPKLSPKFSKGWRVFSEENNLKEGDACVFELDSENKNIMHVQIKYKP